MTLHRLLIAQVAFRRVEPKAVETMLLDRPEIVTNCVTGVRRRIYERDSKATRPQVAGSLPDRRESRSWHGQVAGHSRVQAVAASSSTSASDSNRSEPSAKGSRAAGTSATPWACRPPPWTWAP
jgi:hypothetical protein